MLKILIFTNNRFIFFKRYNNAKFSKNIIQLCNFIQQNNFLLLSNFDIYQQFRQQTHSFIFLIRDNNYNIREFI